MCIYIHIYVHTHTHNYIRYEGRKKTMRKPEGFYKRGKWKNYEREQTQYYVFYLTYRINPYNMYGRKEEWGLCCVKNANRILFDTRMWEHKSMIHKYENVI